MIQRVAVAVDGSPASLEAVHWAAEMVGPQGHILCVDVKDMVKIYRQYRLEAYSGSVPADEWDVLAGETAERVGKLLPPGIAWQWQIITLDPGQGLPAQAFVAHAKAWQAQVLLVGQHRGYRRIEDMFGSFSRWVTVHSQLPTMVVPAPDADAEPEGRPLSS